ncbi:hypothetical protein [Mobilicoccus pelagius]|uniref:Acyl-CoA dehydrogenase n=1 Tax=Mobilicoccus pelagius NBRC 104925 TaxID=1089455 RepID=H5UVG1_9MICO|nr:hypothetical protein [Mobilicoccus pelagius]GAB49719.1 hypothetical protein MOPEL_134_00030 [Mobilicoccus pelagius NBRC 104925]
MTSADLTTLVPAPAPHGFPGDDHRHELTTTELHDAMARLAAERDWATLSWPELLDALVALGRTDVPLSRLTEGHVDAVRILGEAGAGPVAGAMYGVWASRSHATGLRARRDESCGDDAWVLDGTLRFASGSGVLDRALVPVWLDGSTSVLVDVAVDDWTPDTTMWRTGAMRLSHSHTIHLSDRRVDARQVGPEGWYLGRAGFFPGGVGVAAVWAGLGARLLDLTVAATTSAPPNPTRAPRFGRMRADLAAALALVTTAGHRLETLLADSPRGQAVLAPQELVAQVHDLSTEVRAGVATAVLLLAEEARRIVGPAGLAYDEDLTAALHDTELYLRQQNPDSDAAHLGRWAAS